MVVSRPVGWLADNPLRVAGAVAAMAAIAYMTAALKGIVSTGTTVTAESAVTTAAVVEFTMAHPAYPTLAVVGLAALLFGD